MLLGLKILDKQATDLASYFAASDSIRVRSINESKPDALNDFDQNRMAD